MRGEEPQRRAMPPSEGIKVTKEERERDFTNRSNMLKPDN